jgi:hypothetical protein
MQTDSQRTAEVHAFLDRTASRLDPMVAFEIAKNLRNRCAAPLSDDDIANHILGRLGLPLLESEELR